jgi:hypothetical protein
MQSNALGAARATVYIFFVCHVFMVFGYYPANVQGLRPLICCVRFYKYFEMLPLLDF